MLTDVQPYRKAELWFIFAKKKLEYFNWKQFLNFYNPEGPLPNICKKQIYIVTALTIAHG
jgi:hypothetical protein